MKKDWNVKKVISLILAIVGLVLISVGILTKGRESVLVPSALLCACVAIVLNLRRIKDKSR